MRNYEHIKAWLKHYYEKLWTYKSWFKHYYEKLWTYKSWL